MPTRSTSISPDDLAGLAMLANDVLLPLVNAQIAINPNIISGAVWRFHDYALYDSLYVFTSPQPPYLFDWTLKNPIDEINRIRADYYNLVFNSPGSPVYQSAAALNSGPWIVSVNDPDTFPFDLGLMQGSVQAATSPMTLFRSVKFHCGTTQSNLLSVLTARFAQFNVSPSPTVTWSVGSTGGQWTATFTWTIGGPAGAVPAPSFFSPTATPSTGVTWATTGDGAGNITLTATVVQTLSPMTGGSLALSVILPGGYSSPGTVFTSTLILASANTIVEEPNTLATDDTAVSVLAQDVPAASDFYFTEALAGTVYSGTRWLMSNPLAKGYWSAMTFPVPALNVYLDADVPPLVNSYYGYLTLPYFSADYGFVAVNNDIFNLQSVSNPVAASSARQQADFQNGISGGLPVYSTINQSTQPKATAWPVFRDTDFVPFDYGFNSGIAAQNITAARTASHTGALYISAVYIPANATALKVRVVAAASSKIGWTNGVFGYGTPVSNYTIFVKLTAAPTQTVYDYKSVNGGLTLTGAEMTPFLNSGSYIGIQDNNTGADLNFDLQVEIDYGPAVRVFFPPSGVWECFSHSLDGTPWTSTTALAGFSKGSDLAVADWSHPIPQFGHCIFKLRATRLPVVTGGISITPVSGTAITLTVGQNKRQWDGSLKFIPFYLPDNVTPFTVTIQATARDSGDVDVFWPVLGGNEIVYQCSQQIILEAWANFQPKVNFTNFGRFPSTPSSPHGTPFSEGANAPTAWQYCLSFTNYFDSGHSGYPANGTGALAGEWACTHTQFPISVEIYNDLVNSLLLLPQPDSGGGL